MNAPNEEYTYVTQICYQMTFKKIVNSGDWYKNKLNNENESLKKANPEIVPI
jgi:hypothetical protein